MTSIPLYFTWVRCYIVSNHYHSQSLYNFYVLKFGMVAIAHNLTTCSFSSSKIRRNKFHSCNYFSFLKFTMLHSLMMGCPYWDTSNRNTHTYFNLWEHLHLVLENAYVAALQKNKRSFSNLARDRKKLFFACFT